MNKRDIQNGSRCAHCGVHIIAYHELSKMCHDVCNGMQKTYGTKSKQVKMAKVFLNKNDGFPVYRFQCDHVDAYGESSISNYQTICPTCNWQKTSGNDKILREASKRLMRKRLLDLSESLPDDYKLQTPIYNFVESMEECNG